MERHIPMNSPRPCTGGAEPRLGPSPGNLLVALVVIAVAGAAFVFSYDGVHAIALLGGVSAQLARYYPGLFDAVLVIACVAAVMLRDGRWWARLWAWVVIIVVLGAIGTTDVLHAMNYTLRHRLTEGIVAAAPVVAVLLAFSLLLTLLRQSRTQALRPTGRRRSMSRPFLLRSPCRLWHSLRLRQLLWHLRSPRLNLQAPFAGLAAIAPMQRRNGGRAAAEPESLLEDAPAPDVAPTREVPRLPTPRTCLSR